jgi:hypothetical protein
MAKKLAGPLPGELKQKLSWMRSQLAGFEVTTTGRF